MGLPSANSHLGLKEAVAAAHSIRLAAAPPGTSQPSTAQENGTLRQRTNSRRSTWSGDGSVAGVSEDGAPGAIDLQRPLSETDVEELLRVSLLYVFWPVTDGRTICFDPADQNKAPLCCYQLKISGISMAMSWFLSLTSSQQRYFALLLWQDSPFLDLNSPMTAWEWLKIAIMAPWILLRVLLTLLLIPFVWAVVRALTFNATINKPLPR